MWGTSSSKHISHLCTSNVPSRSTRGCFDLRDASPPPCRWPRRGAESSSECESDSHPLFNAAAEVHDAGGDTAAVLAAALAFAVVVAVTVTAVGGLQLLAGRPQCVTSS